MNWKIISIGIGKTSFLNLRVSLGLLARIKVKDENSEYLLFERRVIKTNGKWQVRIQPFGGGAQIFDQQKLADLFTFNYDNSKSKENQDYRLYINSRDWIALRDFTMDKLRKHDAIFETSVEREVYEEIIESLTGENVEGMSIESLKLMLNKFCNVKEEDILFEFNNIGPLVHANPEDNMVSRADETAGVLTGRIFNIQEVYIRNHLIAKKILEVSDISDEDLISRAEANPNQRINSLVLLSKSEIDNAFPDGFLRNEQIYLNDIRFLADNVASTLR